jgi:hypothetical protein
MLISLSVIFITALIVIGAFVQATSSTIGNTQPGTTSYPGGGGGTQEIGDTSANGNTPSGYLRFSSITPSASGTISSLGLNVYTAAGNIEMAIYSDLSGAPDTLLGYSASTPCVTGWNDLPLITPVDVTSGTLYWLCLQHDSSIYTYRLSSGGQQLYQSQTYGAFPDPVSGTLSSNAITHNMRITYAAGMTLQGYARATKAVLSTDTANVTSMSFYSSAIGNFRLALYNDNSGPNSLLWQSASTAASVGWNTVPITSGNPVLQPGTYWLAYQWDSSNAGPNYISGGSGTGSYITLAYGSFPSTWSGATSTSDQWSIYATYEIVPQGTPTPTPSGGTPTPTPNGTPTPTPSPTPTPTPTPAPPTPTPSPTPVPTVPPDTASSSTSAPKLSPTATPAPTEAPTPAPTDSLVATRTTDSTTYTILLSGSIPSSQISGVAIEPSEPDGTTMISFNVNGVDGTTGFTNMTIPKTAIPFGTVPVVSIDGAKAQDQGYTQDTQNYYVWFTTHFSTHDITIGFSGGNTSGSNIPIVEIAVVIIAIVVVAGLVIVLRTKRQKNTTKT